jgi:tripartite-type tricarboxylate transporter receptor subunit TctC
MGWPTHGGAARRRPKNDNHIDADWQCRYAPLPAGYAEHWIAQQGAGATRLDRRRGSFIALGFRKIGTNVPAFNRETRMSRRRQTAVSILLLGLATVVGGARAQEYPAKPIALVMPFPPGGPGDTMARSLAPAIGAALKQQVIVENPSGAGGTIGISRVAKSRPDGYTLLVMNIGMSTAPALYRALPYDVVNDFDPIGRFAQVANAIVARKGLPPDNFKEFLAYAKSGKLSFGHAGLGSAAHLCALFFMNAIQTEFTAVSYKGNGPAMNDLLGGHIDVLCDQTSTTTGHIKSGAVKAYGVTSRTRVASLPDVPTLDEQGLTGFEVIVWWGLWAPKGLPKPVLEKLVAALQAVVVDPAFKARLAQLGAEPVAQDLANPDALRSLLKAEIDKWGPIIRKAGVYAD